MVVVLPHYHFCVAVVEGDGVDLDEDFVGTWGREWRARESEVGDAGLCG